MANKESTQTYLLGFVVGGSAVLVGVVVAWAGLYLFFQKGPDAINLPVIIIIGVVFLLTVLGLLTYSFAALGLANRDEALGLPSGSVRAVIAIMLLVIFAIVAIYVFSVVFNMSQDAGIDLAKQLVTLIGTLVTAVASFYFGTSSIAAVTKPPGNTGGPNAAAVSPGNLNPGGGGQPLTVTGRNLSNVAGVKLTFDGQAPVQADANSIAAGGSSVSCRMTIPPHAPSGPWNVVVSDNANNDSTVPNSVTIGTKPPQSVASPPPQTVTGSVEQTSLNANGASQSVKISGQNLGKVDSIRLIRDGNDDIHADKDSFEPGDTEISCNMTILTGTTSGPWDVALFAGPTQVAKAG